MGGDHSCSVWLAKNSYTTVSSHSVRVSIVGLCVVVVKEHDFWLGLAYEICLIITEMCRV